MKNIKKNIFLFVLFIGINSFSQINTVYYKTIIVKEFDVDTFSKLNKEKQVANFFSNILKKNLTKEFKLSFNTHESNYKEIGNINYENSLLGDEIIFDYVYVDILSKLYLEQKEFLGKSFLISDKINEKWLITNEFKDILGYSCRKAIIKDNHDKEIVAWFTESIPFNFGPEKFSGLPGLILEVEKNGLKIICYKLENEKNVKIIKPKKGQKVNQNEFDLEVTKKMAEIQGFYKE